MEMLSPGCSHVYLIMSRNYLVTCDICDAVMDFDPTAELSVQTAHDTALTALSRYRRIAVAFIEAGSELVTRLHFDRAVQGRGGRLVLLGDTAENELDAHSPCLRWPVLARPVSTQMILAQLAPLQTGKRNNRSLAGLV
ncbi:hypothetical protein [Leisingera caerulea]|uniref:Uncharacterized protein n=1 Tax=Leisingera caerulea TaxID=506591 RepID=A0A9Q9HJL0_LEICA|nr:hypothetical protein [Leisingera caerulea]UWQ49270.1 hypothetical protein K3720_15360 [Leisingera caerulea]UWQ53410.1 hypothetical protein K3721_15670 [Leisingera caerulea]UWQ62171.1 hypothetical protein K3723_15170 [Leisingera caerulea]